MALNGKQTRELEAADRLVTDLSRMFGEERAEFLARAFGRYVNTILETRDIKRP